MVVDLEHPPALLLGMIKNAMKTKYFNGLISFKYYSFFFCFGMFLFTKIASGQTATISLDRNGSETLSPSSSGRFLVTISAGGVTQDTNVNYEVLTSSTSTPDDDYEALSGFIFMADGQETAFIEVDDIVDDIEYEGDETVTVRQMVLVIVCHLLILLVL